MRKAPPSIIFPLQPREGGIINFSSHEYVQLGSFEEENILGRCAQDGTFFVISECFPKKEIVRSLMILVSMTLLRQMIDGKTRVYDYVGMETEL